MTQITDISEAKKGLTKKEPKEKVYCAHSGKVLVDEHNRTLECDKCGAQLDPIDYLLSIARKNDMFWDMRQQYEQEANEAAERVEELKRQERNTKARLKRAREKLKDL